MIRPHPSLCAVVSRCCLALAAVLSAAPLSSALDASPDTPSVSPGRINLLSAADALTIGSIQVKGLVTVPLAEAMYFIGLTAGDTIARDKLEDRIWTISSNLDYTGWFATTKPIVTLAPGSRDTIDIVWELNENPIIGDIEFRGNNAFSTSNLTDVIALRPLAFSLSDGERAQRLALIRPIVESALPAGNGLTGDQFRWLMLDRVLARSEAMDDGGAGLIAEAPDRRPDTRPSVKEDPAGRYIYSISLMNRKDIIDYYHSEGYPDVQVEVRTYPVQYLPDGRPLVVNIVYVINEGRRLEVQDVKIHGLKEFNERDIIDDVLMFVKPGMIDATNDALDIGNLKIDARQRLLMFLQREGYQDAKLTGIWVEVSPVDSHGIASIYRNCVVHFYVDQGERSVCRSVKIQPDSLLIPKKTILDNMLIKPGGVYSAQMMQEDVRMIQKLYGARGRLNARVSVDAKRASLSQHRHFNVTLTINEGREVSAGPIVIRGNEKTKDSVVMRYVKVYPGERLDQKKLDDSFESLRAANIFDPNRITVDNEPTANPEVHRVLVKVDEGREAKTGMFNAGVSYNTSAGVVGQLKFEYRNFDIGNFPTSWLDWKTRSGFFQGGGQTVSLDLFVGATDKTYSLSLIEPWLFNVPVRFSGSVYNEIKAYSEFNRERFGGSVSFGHRLFKTDWTAFADYRLETNEIRNLKNNAEIVYNSEEGQRLLSQLGLSVKHSTVDFPLFTTSGHLVRAGLNFAGGFVGGDDDFVNLELAANQYFPVWRSREGFRHVLRLSAKYEAVAPFGRNDKVPAFHRLYAGGVTGNAIRGFDYQTVTPRDDDVNIGGERMWLATAEYSFPILPQPAPTGTYRLAPDDYFAHYQRELIRLVFYVDAGEVWKPSGDPVYFFTDTDGMRVSYGWGILFKVPNLGAPLKFFFSRVHQKRDGDRTDDFQFWIEYFSSSF